MKIAIKVILFIVFFAMMLIGQKSISYLGLTTMLIGLAGLLGLLWDYNRQYQ